MKLSHNETLLLDQLPEPVVAMDSDGRVIFANRAFSALPSVAQAGPTDESVPSPCCQESVVAMCTRVIASGEPRDFELAEPGPTGPLRWYLGHAIPLSDEGGTRIGALATCADITAQKHCEAGLRRCDEVLTIVQGMAHLGTWEWNTRQASVLWSDELYRIFGLTPETYQPTFDGHLMHVHPDDRTRVSELMDGILKNPVPFSHDERILRPDGSVRHLQCWGKPVCGENGKMNQLVGVCLDMTDAKLRQQKLELALSLQNATLESTADGILVTACDGSIAAFNKRFLDLWRIPPRIIEPRSDAQALAYVLQQLKSPDQFLTTVKALYQSPNAESHDVVEFKDGRIFERCSIPQRLHGKVVGRVWSFRDVTEYRKSDERVHRYSTTLRALAEASRTLAEARLDQSAILDATARWIADLLEDGCVVRLLSTEHPGIDTVAFHHHDPEIERLLGPPLWASHAFFDELAVPGCRHGQARCRQRQGARAEPVPPECRANMHRIGLSQWILCVRIGGGSSASSPLSGQNTSRATAPRTSRFSRTCATARRSPSTTRICTPMRSRRSSSARTSWRSPRTSSRRRSRRSRCSSACSKRSCARPFPLRRAHRPGP